jgi:hypothetical protein
MPAASYDCISAYSQVRIGVFGYLCFTFEHPVDIHWMHEMQTSLKPARVSFRDLLDAKMV